MPPHIFTITPNPNLDRTLTVPNVRLNEVLRATESRVDPGGKGFNVARALAALGMASAPMAFLGGDTGLQLAALMQDAGVAVRHIPIADATRTCYVVTDAEGRSHLKVNEQGPRVTEAESTALFAAVERDARPGDLWVLAGSLPPGLENDFYARLVRLLRAAGARPVLDASGEALREGLAAAPFLMKPNALEAGEVLGVEISTPGESARAAAQLCRMGVEMVAVSLGADGLVLAQGATCVHAQPPAVQARNTVGAGDATVAGMLWALVQGLPLDEIARRGAACGAAAAMRAGTDFGTYAEVCELAAHVHVERISA